MGVSIGLVMGSGIRMFLLPHPSSHHTLSTLRNRTIKGLACPSTQISSAMHTFQTYLSFSRFTSQTTQIMGYTIYDGTIVVAEGILNTLSHILHQAEQHPNGSTLLAACLHEDMYPVTDQVRLATQFSENLVARLSGREPVTFDGSPTTFA